MLMIESSGGCREDFEYPQRSMELAQWGSQNRADTESPAACQIHLRIIFRIVTKHDFPATQTLSGNTCIGLQSNPDIGCRPTCTRSADNFTSTAQRNCGTCCPCQRLR